MHFSFRSCILYFIYFILDFMHWHFTWQLQVNMTCDTVWYVTCHFTGQYHLRCYINFSWLNHPVTLRKYFVPPGSVHRDLFTPLIGVRHPRVNMFINLLLCGPASNSSAKAITASCLKWAECHPFGYKISTPFGHKSLKSFLSTSQELKMF